LSFTWGPLGPANLVLDILILASGIFSFIFAIRKSGGLPPEPSRKALQALRLGLWLSLLPWAVGAFLLGGFLGFCLFAHTLWTIATVLIPLVAAYLCQRWRRAWLLLFFFLPLAAKYYGEAWEPRRLEVEHISITSKNVRAPIRIAHISDLQTDGIGRMQFAARDAANKHQPHLIVFTGDVLNHPALVPEVHDYLRGFKSLNGSYFVGGNVDSILPPEFFTGSGFERIDDSARLIDINGTKVGILGLGLGQFWGTKLLNELIRQTDKADLRILLSHLPDTLIMAKDARVDVLFCGHTHGGQVALPWFGPIVKMSRVARAIAAGGLHKVGKLYVVVSRGLGMEGHIAPRVRAFSRPHLILCEIFPAPRSNSAAEPSSGVHSGVQKAPQPPANHHKK
jgi:hypothetical protein